MRERLRNGYTQAHAQIMQHTHTHKAVTGCVEPKKLLSRRRQSNYNHSFYHTDHIIIDHCLILYFHYLEGYLNIKRLRQEINVRRNVAILPTFPTVRSQLSIPQSSKFQGASSTLD